MAAGLRNWGRAALWLVPLVAASAIGCGSDEELPPLAIESALCPRDTCDSRGPYQIDAAVNADAGVRAVSIRIYSEPGADPAGNAIPMDLVDGDLSRGIWSGTIAGQVPGAVIFYAVELIDNDSRADYAPAGTPFNLFCFRVLDATECATRDVAQECNLCSK